MVSPLVVLASAGPVVASGLTYAISKRTKSGKIADTDADKLWDAASAYQTRIDGELNALRDRTKKLDDDYLNERRARMECEMRLTALEAQSAAALIIENANAAAAEIRADAIAAKKVVKADAAAAKQKIADEE